MSLISQTIQTIKHLRAENQLLQAQMDIVTIFATALGLRKQPGPSGIDICYELEQHFKQEERAKPMNPQKGE